MRQTVRYTFVTLFNILLDLILLKEGVNSA